MVARTARRAPKRSIPAVRVAIVVLLLAVIAGVVAFIIPASYTLHVEHETATKKVTQTFAEFPVTVFPKRKVIVENDAVNSFLSGPTSPLAAATGGTLGSISRLFNRIAAGLTGSSWYEALAATDSRVVYVTPGMRKEQVAAVFASALNWNADEQTAFLTKAPYAVLPLPEGSYAPGSYLVAGGTTPQEAQQMVNDRFSDTVLSHYGTTTASVVPLNEALTIASMIQREASGPSDMRLISGIMWNRLFIGMPLQIDATLQYAKADSETSGSWWPAVYQSYEKIDSPYNTYENKGLPPAPIAEPSVAAILAALNPVDTSCLYYFHDQLGQIHCSDTYSEHLSQIQQYH